jgi:hypothetical protein
MQLEPVVYSGRFNEFDQSHDHKVHLSTARGIGERRGLSGKLRNICIGARTVQPAERAFKGQDSIRQADFTQPSFTTFREMEVVLQAVPADHIRCINCGIVERKHVPTLDFLGLKRGTTRWSGPKAHLYVCEHLKENGY